ncbi:MAG: hypothetical protein WCQ99_14995, partial [Pseudomonadota bacterium]
MQAKKDADPIIKVLIETKASDDDNQTKTITGLFNWTLDLIKQIDFTQITYTPKSTLYLAMRELGLKSEDARWRYKQNGSLLTVQAGMHIPVSQALTLLLYGDHDFPLVKIKFSVDTDGDGRRNTFILPEQIALSKKSGKEADIVTVDLIKTCKNAGLDPDKTVILEPIIFIGAEFSAFQKNPSLKKLVFLGSKSPEQGEIVSPDTSRAGSTMTLDFNFESLLKNNYSDNQFIRKITVEAHLREPQAMIWQGGMLYDVSDEQMPSVALEPHRMFQTISKNNADQSFNQFTKSYRPLIWKRHYEKSPNDFFRRGTENTPADFKTASSQNPYPEQHASLQRSWQET